MDFVCRYRSPLGGMTMASDGETLVGLWFDGQKHFANTLAEHPTEKMLPVFAETARWLDLYFGGVDPGFLPPVSTRGSDFRRAVWELLLSIPYGKTATYGEIAAKIAQKLGRPRMAARAVGGAVGHNAIALVIPCHRVIGADGSLTGYAGGTARKKYLLALEGAAIMRKK